MANGRDSKGRFAKGNRIAKGNGAGRHPRRTEDSYLRAMYQVVTAEDWEKITLTAIAMARAGDKAARDWLSGYLIGKPIERQERGKVGEFQSYLEHQRRTEEDGADPGQAD